MISPIRTVILSCIALLAASVARADPCDDLAKQLANQVTGLKVGKTVANVIYLQHSAAKQAWLGCSGHTVSNEISASSPARKPSADFTDLVGTLSALVFTIPKNDAVKGVNRCVGRIGLLRGYNITTRYRKLDIRCTRTKDATQVTVSRERQS